MNKIFKVASVAIIAFSANTIFAQSTNLHVNVQDIYSIVVTDTDVTIDMNQPGFFVSGNSSAEQSNHIEVSATGEYQVSVAAALPLTGATSGETIDQGTIVVTANNGTYLGAQGTDAGSSASFTAATLSSGGAPLVTGSAGDLRGFDVTYSIPAASAPAYLNVAEDIYTTTVTYSIAPN